MDRQKCLELVDDLDGVHQSPSVVAPPLIAKDDGQVVQVDELLRAARFLAVAVDSRVLGPATAARHC